jgi:hypothetical protein
MPATSLAPVTTPPCPGPKVEAEMCPPALVLVLVLVVRAYVDPVTITVTSPASTRRVDTGQTFYCG